MYYNKKPNNTIEETFLFNDQSLKILPQIIALVYIHYLICALCSLFCSVKMAVLAHLPNFNRIIEVVDSLFSSARIYSPRDPPSEWNFEK